MNSELISHYRTPLLLGASGFVFLIVATIVAWVPSASQSTEAIQIISAHNADIPSGEQQEIVIDIQGAIKIPGVYTLPLGARVVDLISVAGGFTKTADVYWIAQHINQAQLLTDGAKLYIPFQGEHDVRETSEVSDMTVKTININTATQSELESLSGIGEVTAKKIIQNRPYGQLNDLLDKNVLGEKTFENIVNEITVL